MAVYTVANTRSTCSACRAVRQHEKHAWRGSSGHIHVSNNEKHGLRSPVQHSSASARSALHVSTAGHPHIRGFGKVTNRVLRGQDAAASV
jgi:hypothetical protein